MITVEEYYKMADSGLIAPDSRVELLDGEIVEMAPIGYRHGFAVAILAKRFTLGLGDRAWVWNQTDVPLNLYSALQPDLALLHPTSYAERAPGPADVFLVVEVADTSVASDRNRKVPMYLAAGIPEVWLVDLNAQLIEVYLGDTVRTHRPGGTLSPQAFPDIAIDVSEVTLA